MDFDGPADAPAVAARAPRLNEVAAAAGVSTATADRVLNRRKGVKERTVHRVLQAALDLGYLSQAEASRLASPRPPNAAFLLPMGNNPYLRLLGDKLRALAASRSRDGARVRCFFIDSFDAGALAASIRHQADWADGIVFLAIDHPVVREAVEDVTAAGKHVVTLVSDLPHPGRAAYFGLDNRAAGRTAGYLLGRFCGAGGGSVALVAGSPIYRAHSEREAGFLGLIAERFPGLRPVGTREGHDDSDENYRHAIALMEQHPDLVGIYNVGGSSQGIGRALREKGRAGEVVFIGHGLTPDTRRLLIDGTMDAVINSDPDAILAGALDLLHRLRHGDPPPAAVPPVKMDLFFRENLPVAFRPATGQRPA
ncbi:LacI family DNA-binding transcriptional regulator [Azospirillum halopraeferens]|uniref:LacI family DNA-binding transcriptional regulator n=1 Tax=Azospirillum halopraeferens TaxID=34010 RepID=UPI001B3BEFA8|nr:LacI family DNA-binding transcriptional regulator [Azospirillum halopraeferens]